MAVVGVVVVGNMLVDEVMIAWLVVVVASVVVRVAVAVEVLTSPSLSYLQAYSFLFFSYLFTDSFFYNNKRPIKKRRVGE